MNIEVEFPDKLQMLFKARRYKIARGGRGSAKSWSFARALILKADSEPLRILCAREVQTSIKDSVHKLLADQILAMGLSKHFRVFDTQIRGLNGSEFAFTGLSTMTADAIKSYEGFDICWVEEGQTVSKRSWDILIPTIRKEASEIWVSYNPQLETDETHQRFTIHPPENCYNVLINWRDNPWFNDVLNQERLHCKKTQPDDYENIWEGKCRPAVEGAIYYKQIQEAELQNRIKAVPYDPMLKVQVVFDLGWEDSLAIGLVQKLTSEIRIIEYLEAYQTKLDVMSSELRARGLNWGKVWLPHDGFSAHLNSNGLSTSDILRGLGWDVVPREEIVELSPEEGIRATRLKFHQCYFNQDTTNAVLSPQTSKAEGFYHSPLSWRLVEILKRYRRSVNQKSQAVGKPVHDQYAHGADMMRYMAINSDLFTNETQKPLVFRPSRAIVRRAA